MSRPSCPACCRPLSHCYCDQIVKVANHTPVVIIQHPLESKHPYNTGRILALCLTQVRTLIAETLSSEQLEPLLTPGSLLLYPEFNWLSPAAHLAEQIKQLIVIDASWRKSKKILHLNPPLQSLPRMTINSDQPSAYQIRKTKLANGLSTLESTALALKQIDGHAYDEQLNRPFKAMIERHKKPT